MNSLSKIFAMWLCVILMFVFPIYYSFQKQDGIIQLNVSTEVSKFTDNIKNHGYIDSDMYNRFIRKIDTTNYLFDVTITHSHRNVVPHYNEEGNFLNEYDVFYIDTYEDEIFQAFDNGEIYRFEQDDYINVTVVNRTETMATKIMKRITGRDIDKEQIIVVYGGIIRDELD